ncbi:hypothetical protein PR202_gb02203 [Eleusine coracana subsp. coracana]|uniref:VOC domain-containing protein n=1 Tax=Eleusine coracana subsp. coracana TaxID=191504 RepID=A0AAV5DYQ1_ELECO|nr:hypothetical protein PR202_gb02203 [Eleusine coracana subsp. coracana]
MVTRCSVRNACRCLDDAEEARTFLRAVGERADIEVAGSGIDGKRRSRSRTANSSCSKVGVGDELLAMMDFREVPQLEASPPPGSPLPLSSVIWFPEYMIFLGARIGETHSELMHRVQVEIAHKLRNENKQCGSSEKIPERVYKKLFTPLNGVWYLLSGHQGVLPSKAQVPYHRTEKLAISTSYKDIGGYVDMGPPAFKWCFNVLSKSDVYCKTERGIKILKSGPLAVPPLGISEAIRFPKHRKFLKISLKGEYNRTIPGDISADFTEWGDYSTSMYTKKVPFGCHYSVLEIRSRIGVLRCRNEREDDAYRSLLIDHGVKSYDKGNGFGHFTIADNNIVKLTADLKSKGCKLNREPGLTYDDTTLSAEAEDKDGYKFKLLNRNPGPEPLCQIMIHVGDLDRSTLFYQKGLGMKIITEKDIPHEQVTI